MTVDSSTYDVIVVGGGNAALCAAITAREEGARVLVLERAPESERGGNSSYTEGLMRFVFDGVGEIRALAPDLTDEEVARSDFGAYTEENYFDDMARLTQNRTDPDLCEILVDTGHEPIRGLFAAGEMVGGVFYHNYPGSSGLTSGTVFGRIAGSSAARTAREIR